MKSTCIFEHKYVKDIGLELGAEDYSCKRLWRPVGLWDVDAPIFPRKSDHTRQRDCPPFVPAALYPQEDSWYPFLLEAEPIPGPFSGKKD
jgi:hypothetical protein